MDEVVHRYIEEDKLSIFQEDATTDTYGRVSAKCKPWHMTVECSSAQGKFRLQQCLKVLLLFSHIQNKCQ